MTSIAEITEVRDQLVQLIKDYKSEVGSFTEPDEDDPKYWDEDYRVFDDDLYNADFDKWEDEGLSVYLVAPVMDAIDGNGWHSSRLSCSF